MSTISPFLWFDTQAKEAAEFYVNVFSHNPFRAGETKITHIVTYPDAGEEVTGKPAGSVMTVEFLLDGTEFTALNGGPHLKMSGGVSFVVGCDSQEEVDYFWDKLSEGGEAGQCGWINHDKFGMTWQVVPAGMGEYLGGSDAEGSKRAMEAMLKMKKLDINELKAAYEGK